MREEVFLWIYMQNNRRFSTRAHGREAVSESPWVYRFNWKIIFPRLKNFTKRSIAEGSCNGTITCRMERYILSKKFVYIHSQLLQDVLILTFLTFSSLNANVLLIFQITFANKVGRFDIDVTTFQMAVLFAWNQRPNEKISYENLRLATELPDPELRRTLWSLCAFPKLKRQLLLVEPHAATPKDFANDTRFWVNQEFAIVFVFLLFLDL